MIIVAKPCTSNGFYENIYALQERLKQIEMCCGQVINDVTCPTCGNSDSNYFYSPLSLKNKIVSLFINLSLFLQFLVYYNLFLTTLSGIKISIHSHLLV